MTTTAPAIDIADRIAATIDPVFAVIDGWRHDLAAHLDGVGEPRARELDPVVAELVGAELERPGTLITGAGFVAAPGFLVDAPWHLAWWLSGASTFRTDILGTGLRRLDAVSDPDSEAFRDYTTLEWWRVPERTHRRHLTGPYVDYLCTDDYTVTITSPIVQDGEMTGLVGTDVYVARLEQALVPVIRSADRTCTVVNASGRIVASTDLHRATGALLRLDGLTEALAPLREREGDDDGAPRAADGTATPSLPGGAEVVPCGDTSLALVLE
ncbi:cache domain-containing protein [Agromyces sp. SYSU T0242]|uniref:cache domain-containing protein n=1 Tax=Agromyces litoreus TaxID=3158561 RepID=UPI003396864E